MLSYAYAPKSLLLEAEGRRLERLEGPRREVDDVLQPRGLEAGEDAGQRGEGTGAGGLGDQP